MRVDPNFRSPILEVNFRFHLTSRNAASQKTRNESENSDEDDDPERLEPEIDPLPSAELGQNSHPTPCSLPDEDIDRYLQHANEFWLSYKQSGDKTDLDLAVHNFTTVIEDRTYNSFTAELPSALVFAKRGWCFLEQKRPLACIEDCTAALKQNPDLARAYRTRGTAYRKLGNWEKARADLSTAQKVDFDEDTEKVGGFCGAMRRLSSGAVWAMGEIGGGPPGGSSASFRGWYYFYGGLS